MVQGNGNQHEEVGQDEQEHEEQQVHVSDGEVLDDAHHIHCVAMKYSSFNSKKRGRKIIICAKSKAQIQGFNMSSGP